MNEIVELESRHCLDLAALHLRYLNTRFYGTIGQRLIAAYYNAISHGIGASGYVAQKKGQPVGYVCGVWSRRELHKILFKTQWPALFFWGVACALFRPRLIVSLSHRIGWSEGWKIDCSIKEYELRPIIVDFDFWGTQIATRLVQRIMVDAKNRNFESIHLFVEDKNKRAQSFYLKMGFSKVNSFCENGRLLVRYEQLLMRENER